MKKFLFLSALSIFSIGALNADHIDMMSISMSQTPEQIQKQIKDKTSYNHSGKFVMDFYKFHNEILKGSDILSGIEYSYNNPGGYKLEICSVTNQATKYTPNYRFNITNKYHFPYGEALEIFPLVSLSSMAQSAHLIEQNIDRGIQKTQFTMGFGLNYCLSSYFSFSPEIGLYHEISRLKVCKRSDAPVHWWASNLTKRYGFKASLALKTRVFDRCLVEFTPYWERSIQKQDDVRGTKFAFAFLF